MLTPKVGDTVVVRGVVLTAPTGFVYIKTSGSMGELLVSLDRITEVIPKPWEPAVGDTVVNSVSHSRYVIGCLHGDKTALSWGTNGISIVSLDDLKKAYKLCVD